MRKQQAKQLADETAAILGPGWAPDIWENCGWHARAVSACGRWKVHPNIIYPGMVAESYTAFLGSPDSAGGRYAESGKTPQKAIRATRDKAEAEAAEIQKLLAP